MKKRLFSLILIILCLATLLSSCGVRSFTLKSLVSSEDYEDPSKAFTTAKEIDGLGKVTRSAGDLIALQNENNRKATSVYNLSTDKIIWTAPEDGEKGYFYTPIPMFTNGVSWFYVSKNLGVDVVATDTYLAYNKDGELLLSEECYRVNTVSDLIFLDNKVFRVNPDETITKVSELDQFSSTTISGKTGKYYYYVSYKFYTAYASSAYDLLSATSAYTTAGPTVTTTKPAVTTTRPAVTTTRPAVTTTAPQTSRPNYKRDFQNVVFYDEELNFVYEYAVPSYAVTPACFFLENGNLLLQYSINHGEFAKNYSYIEDGNKFELKSFLISPNKQSAKELDLDFIVRALITHDSDSLNPQTAIGISDKKNLAAVSFIKNGKVDTDALNSELVLLKNNGNLKSKLDNVIPGKISDIVRLSEERWVLTNNAMQKYLVNSDGDIIGDVTGCDAINGSYIIKESEIYDLDLEKKCDMADYQMLSFVRLENGVLFYSYDRDVFLYSDGQVNKLFSGSDNMDYSIVDSCIITYGNVRGPKITVYNSRGEILYTADNNGLFSDAKILTYSPNFRSYVLQIDISVLDESQQNSQTIEKYLYLE